MTDNILPRSLSIPLSLHLSLILHFSASIYPLLSLSLSLSLSPPPPYISLSVPASLYLLLHLDLSPSLYESTKLCLSRIRRILQQTPLPSGATLSKFINLLKLTVSPPVAGCTTNPLINVPNEPALEGPLPQGHHYTVLHKLLFAQNVHL